MRCWTCGQGRSARPRRRPGALTPLTTPPHPPPPRAYTVHPRPPAHVRALGRLACVCLCVLPDRVRRRGPGGKVEGTMRDGGDSSSTGSGSGSGSGSSLGSDDDSLGDEDEDLVRACGP